MSIAALGIPFAQTDTLLPPRYSGAPSRQTQDFRSVDRTVSLPWMRTRLASHPTWHNAPDVRLDGLPVHQAPQRAPFTSICVRVDRLRARADVGGNSRDRLPGVDKIQDPTRNSDG